ncbi:MAG: hypothetical protein C6I00_06040 [Nitratiruptor sp.]|nr:hypothetical protein [Nitratiruptor sp.]NPA83003.1 hypothetical protein [Campylobacterota bacterium]
MVVVVPVANPQGANSKVCPITQAKAFAFLRLGEGMEIEGLEFREGFANELFDYIVTPKRNDALEEAFDLGARALLAMDGMSLEEIVEAMMFRELDEIE